MVFLKMWQNWRRKKEGRKSHGIKVQYLKHIKRFQKANKIRHYIIKQENGIIKDKEMPKRKTMSNYRKQRVI